MTQPPLTGWDRPSAWAKLYDITPFKTDAKRWHNDWEKLLPTLSASQDVYPIMSRWLIKDHQTDEEPSTRLEAAMGQLAAIQEWFARRREMLIDDGELVTAWYLLDEKDRRRYITSGIEAISLSSLGQDLRPLCPEVSLSFMLKQKGRVFIEFVDNLMKGKESVGEGKPYFVPSAWWEAAESDSVEQDSDEGRGSRSNDDSVEAPVGDTGNDDASNSDSEDLDTEVSDDSDPEVSDDAYQMLTVYRNETIARFLIDVFGLIIHDLSHRAPGMDSVMQFMESHGSWADTAGSVLSKLRDKPIVRCENCTLTPEEIGGNVKFMVCSQCKSKLDFVLHYCSRKCQEEDWKNHKRHCGKEKVSKKLRGTAHDPFWAHPSLPDHLQRTMPLGRPGGTPTTELGIPDPMLAPSYSPALRRQAALLTADTEAEYILFDKEDRPVRVVVDDEQTKFAFRILRCGLFGTAEPRELPPIAQYLTKVMSTRPGLSKETILAQLSSEYKSDVGQELASFERDLAKNSDYAGTTFLEATASNLLPMVRNHPFSSLVF